MLELFKTTSDQLESKQHEIETIKQQNQHNESKLSQEFNDLSEKNKVNFEPTTVTVTKSNLSLRLGYDFYNKYINYS